MVYLLGTKNREYVIDGIVIPKKSYSEREIELGRKAVVGIDDIVYAKLSANSIFQSLVKNGDVLVRDREPEGQETMSELRNKFNSTREESAQKIAELTAENDKLRKENDELKAEALAEIKKRDDQIKELKQLLEDAR